MKESGFSVPREDRYFEDYVAGSVHEFGPASLDKAEIIEFGKRFVPQPYHTDAELAKKTIYKGLSLRWKINPARRCPPAMGSLCWPPRRPVYPKAQTKEAGGPSTRCERVAPGARSRVVVNIVHPGFLCNFWQLRVFSGIGSEEFCESICHDIRFS